jgi:hypothetical protein
LRRNAETLQVFDGRIDGTTMTLKFKNPGGGRTITLTGQLQGDEISFTRQVDVAPGGALGGQGFFGARGARTFTARRTR